MSKLYQELLLSNHVRTNRRLVAPVTIDNIHSILDSSTLSAYVYSNRLVYVLDFPLVQNDPLTLYHIYSVPIQHPNSSYHTTILPEHTYLATNPNGQQYISTSSLENCRIYTSKQRVCTNLIVYDSTTRPICEMQILFSISTSIPNICTTTTFAADINTFQSLSNNQWLYILTNETQCVLQCEKEVSHHKLQGAGIVSLPRRCKLHTTYSTLSTFQSSEENITTPIIIPDIRTEDCFEEMKNLQAPNLIPISINELPLDSLHQIKTHIDKYSEELQKLKSQNFLQKHETSFSWVYFIIGITLLAFATFKFCKRWPNGFIKRNRNRRNSNSCIQIFNNCFDSSSRRQATHLHAAIPMSTIAVTTETRISEDEDDDIRCATPSQRSGANAQSLF